MKMKTEEIIKLIKYVTGSVAAVLLAAALQLQFAYAAGIITLLTIQDTKKETVRITAKRMIIFVIMTILSAVIFPFAGYHVWAFGIVLIPYLFSCMALDMKEAIAPIAVLCTHYVSAKSCSPSMILNEFLILVIGAWMIKSCTSYTEWRSTLNWRTKRIILEAALMNWMQCL